MPKVYRCDCCNYTAPKKYNFNRHLQSNKHLKNKEIEPYKDENEFTIENQLKLEKEKSKLLNNIIILQEVIYKLSLIE